MGRWTQPDTDVPESQGVQAFDRFAYVNNNPVRYTDPSGHCVDDNCSPQNPPTPEPTSGDRCTASNGYAPGCGSKSPQASTVPMYGSSYNTTSYWLIIAFTSVLSYDLFARGASNGGLPYIRSSDVIRGEDGSVIPTYKPVPMGGSAYETVEQLEANTSYGDIYKLPAGSETGNFDVIPDGNPQGHNTLVNNQPGYSLSKINKEYSQLSWEKQNINALSADEAQKASNAATVIRGFGMDREEDNPKMR